MFLLYFKLLRLLNSDLSFCLFNSRNPLKQVENDFLQWILFFLFQYCLANYFFLLLSFIILQNDFLVFDRLLTSPTHFQVPPQAWVVLVKWQDDNWLLLEILGGLVYIIFLLTSVGLIFKTYFSFWRSTFVARKNILGELFLNLLRLLLSRDWTCLQSFFAVEDNYDGTRFWNNFTGLWWFLIFWRGFINWTNRWEQKIIEGILSPLILSLLLLLVNFHST